MSMSTVRIESDRFVGMTLSTDHTEHLTALYRDRDVIGMLAGPAGPFSDEAIGVILQRLRSHWDAHGFGPYAFFSKEDQSFAGYAGLRHTISDGVSGVELLYAVRTALWGQGICTEIARVTVDQGFSELKLKEMVSFALVENTASRRVLSKLGFVYEGVGNYGGLPHARYRLSGVASSEG